MSLYTDWLEDRDAGLTRDGDVVEVDGWRSRNAQRRQSLTEAEVAAGREESARRTAARIERYGYDHHFDPEHPDYDPNCYCGIDDERVIARGEEVANHIDEYDVQDEAKAKRSRNRKIERKMAQPMTPAQERFLRKLEAEASDPTIAAEIRELVDPEDESDRPSKAEASKMIEKALEAAKHDDSKPAKTNRYAGDCVRCGRNVPAETGELSKSNGSWIVSHFPECPEAPADEPKTETKPTVEEIDEDGLYVLDETIYKVQIAKQGSGRLYAKRLEVRKVGDRYESEWIYEGRKPLRKLRPENRMTEAQAAAFGQLYGICGVCGRDLTDETSIELGIGPICRQRF